LLKEVSTANQAPETNRKGRHAMTTTMTATSTLFRQAFLLVALALTGAAGCGAPEELDQAEQVAETEEEALKRGGGSPRLGYSCSGGTCECSKAIENDCADMSAVCTDATVDALIACINGWATTHCTCTQAFVAPKPSPYTVPITGGVVQRR
jgi:hypothetical protein